ncbi:CoA transferase, partial [Halomonas sp. HMF6819]|uniref:CoA transferase n=1 Tax=Halomonas sp. HMF6819 TaxID=3373085 RepID=UPI00379EC2A4
VNVCHSGRITMLKNNSHDRNSLPLAGCYIVERSQNVAAAYAGRLLATLGATVVMLEPPQGSCLRNASPLLKDGTSALFSYLAAGKHSKICDLQTDQGRAVLAHELGRADIFIDDTPLKARKALSLDPDHLRDQYPGLVHVSVLPFGSSGPKSDWDGEEVNLIHASGEGFLLPNGRSNELFPERPPLKIYGHFSQYQGGCAAALSALAAWWAALQEGGQYVDVSVQDAMLLCGAFAMQRLGDGSLEHRATRSFKYGGVFEALDGYVELLTLEDRQWSGLVQLMGSPAWATDEALKDPLERSRRGDDLNAHIRAWMSQHTVDTIVDNAQKLGVPAGKYRTPAEVVNGEHESLRGLFSKSTLPNGLEAKVLVAPYRFQRTPLTLGQVPALASCGEQAAARGEGA